MMRIAATSLLPGRRKGPIFLTDLNVSSQNTAMNIGVKSGSQADAGRNRFTLTGRSVALDRRVNALRGGLEDVALAGRYFEIGRASGGGRGGHYVWSSVCGGNFKKKK